MKSAQELNALSAHILFLKLMFQVVDPHGLVRVCLRGLAGEKPDWNKNHPLGNWVDPENLEPASPSQPRLRNKFFPNLPVPFFTFSRRKLQIWNRTIRGSRFFWIGSKIPSLVLFGFCCVNLPCTWKCGTSP